MTEIAQQHLDCDGCPVHYLEAGDPAGPVVVLLHGMKFNAATWQELGTIEFLAGLGYRVIAADMPGFGNSPAAERPPVEVLERFLAALSLSQLTLVGPSMGGRTTLEYALADQSRLQGLVLVGAVGVAENKERLSEIAVPLLAIWGGEDAVSPVVLSELLVEQVVAARRVIFPGAPHPCYLEQTDQFHETLKEFLSSL
ncbi:alpha/beta fold hydrolase [Desulfogranum mediterraneum]|uniref:alpha/beta fold hydrolase n=1 Tax=Desulfogranum mediterraneum TaxID=160661 RepID=UPI0004079057|nr:alpha/beta hydrolase [Desulfogranum mediterraneum]